MTLIYLACAWLLGIYLGSLLHFPVQVLGTAVVTCLAGLLFLRSRPRARLGTACLLILCFGLWRYGLAVPKLTPGPLAAYNDQQRITFRGVVVNDPVPRDRWANLQISVRELEANGAWTPIQGQVLVQVPSYSSYRYGDELEVYGQLETPPASGTFSYRAYLARQGIHSLLRYPHITVRAREQGSRLSSILYSLKRRTQNVIHTVLPEPESALLTGILLGTDEGIPDSLMDKFRATGTAHIIAISGFNITLMSAALVKVFSRILQRYAALIVAVAAIALYTVLVGAEPPVVRAAIMGGLSAVALIVGRKSDGLTSLLAAAWCMTAWDPFLVWDIAFQLSFAASLGLIVYADRLKVGLEKLLRRFVSLESAERTTRLLHDTLLVTVAAQITTLPVMVYHFGQFSPLSLIANLLVLPVQPTIMYLGSTAALAGLAYLPLGQVLGWAAWLFLAWTIRVVEAMASFIQTSDAARSVHALVPFAYYVLLAFLTWTPPLGSISTQKLKRLWRKGAVRRGLFAALLVTSILVWATVASLPDGKLHVTYLDVGQGDAILVQTPAGHRLLIDGGPSPATLLAALGRRLPFWDRRIDIVMLSHPHEDHLRGLLPVLDRYQVRQALAGDVNYDSSVYPEWQRLLQEKSVPLLTVQQPIRVDFGDGPLLEILPAATQNADSLDEPSLVARLVWQQAAFLFTADLEADHLLDLGDAGWPLSCTVLKVPHHGSADGVSDSLLAAAGPELAIISVGADNRFGHPAAETLECLESSDVQVLRTDEMGTVEITTDGHRYWVRTGDQH